MFFYSLIGKIKDNLDEYKQKAKLKRLKAKRQGDI